LTNNVSGKNDCSDCNEEGLCALFNTLSLRQKAAIVSAAATNQISAFVLEDTKNHPHFFPLYGAYLFFMIMPIPLFGTSTLLLGSTLLWARYSKSDYANRLNDRLKHAFNPRAAALDYTEAVICDALNGAIHIDGPKLARISSSRSWNDTKEAAGLFGDYIKSKLSL
jgi:hypothetical protein